MKQRGESSEAEPGIRFLNMCYISKNSYLPHENSRPGTKSLMAHLHDGRPAISAVF